jgi:hypothetical protein
MEYNEIEKVLNRYLEGESTLEEEAKLREYFSQPGLTEDQVEFREMFRYFAEAKQDSTPAFDITNELNSVIESEFKKESVNRIRHWYAWAGSAAAVLIISFGLFQYLQKPESEIKDTYKDPKLAYIETRQALMKISKVMNKSTAKLKYLSNVDASIEQVQKIAKIDKVVNSVKNQKK